MSPIHVDADVGSGVTSRTERAGSQPGQAIALDLRICWAHEKQKQILSNNPETRRMTRLLWDTQRLDPYKRESDCAVCFHLQWSIVVGQGPPKSPQRT